MSEDGVTAGMLLRRAREAAGLHVAALAVSLKVPVRKLEALEEDRYDLLTDAVFVRALASSICRTLKIDPQPVLDRLPQTTAPRLARDVDSINATFRAPSDAAPATWRHQLTRPVFLAVFGLLLAALVVVLLPAGQQENMTAEVTAAGNAKLCPLRTCRSIPLFRCRRPMRPAPRWRLRLSRRRSRRQPLLRPRSRRHL